VIQHHVEHHPQSDGVRVRHEPAQFVVASEGRFDREEVLGRVPVIVALLARGWDRLLQHGADPQCGDAQPAQVAELAPQPVQGAARPIQPGLPPAGRVGLGTDRIALVGWLEQRGVARDGLTRKVEVAVLVAVGESVDEQEVQHLVLPRRR
jgi:hypothetical protein